jgi:hypothetical protein
MVLQRTEIALTLAQTELSTNGQQAALTPASRTQAKPQIEASNHL